MRFQFDDIKAAVVISRRHTLIKTRAPVSVLKSYAHDMACRFQREEKVDLFVEVQDLRPKYFAGSDWQIPEMPDDEGPLAPGVSRGHHTQEAIPEDKPEDIPEDKPEHPETALLELSRAGRKYQDEIVSEYGQHMADLLNRTADFTYDGWCKNVGFTQDEHLKPPGRSEHPAHKIDLESVGDDVEAGSALRDHANRRMRAEAAAREDAILGHVDVYQFVGNSAGTYIVTPSGTWYRAPHGEWVESDTTLEWMGRNGFMRCSGLDRRDVVEDLAKRVREHPESRNPFDFAAIDENGKLHIRGWEQSKAEPVEEPAEKDYFAGDVEVSIAVEPMGRRYEVTVGDYRPVIIGRKALECETVEVEGHKDPSLEAIKRLTNLELNRRHRHAKGEVTLSFGKDVGPVQFRSNQDLARNGAVAIECEHGYDCCPVCDADDS